mgnify:CR=1 FL=1
MIFMNSLKFYNKNIAGTYKAGFTVTNTFNVPDEKINVTVTKNWDDNSNVNAKRPTSIKYVLNGGLTPVEQVVIGNRTTNFKLLFNRFISLIFNLFHIYF